jgi:hypothetical protein
MALLEQMCEVRTDRGYVQLVFFVFEDVWQQRNIEGPDTKNSCSFSFSGDRLLLPPLCQRLSTQSQNVCQPTRFASMCPWGLAFVAYTSFALATLPAVLLHMPQWRPTCIKSKHPSEHRHEVPYQSLSARTFEHLKCHQYMIPECLLRRYVMMQRKEEKFAQRVRTRNRRLLHVVHNARTDSSGQSNPQLAHVEIVTHFLVQQIERRVSVDLIADAIPPDMPSPFVRHQLVEARLCATHRERARLSGRTPEANPLHSKQSIHR